MGIRGVGGGVGEGEKPLRSVLCKGNELPVSHLPGWRALQHQAASKATGIKYYASFRLK